MVRVPAVLALLMAVSVAACGSSETSPDEQAPVTTSAATAEPSPVIPDDAPPQEEADHAGGEHLGAADRTCTDSIGAAAATRLAERCRMVSTASHPPCNPANACALIQDEINRSCAQYGAGETKPAECAG